jgi:hypothetical protein
VGNVTSSFPISAYAIVFNSKTHAMRIALKQLVSALPSIGADRRLLLPSETVNGLTVGDRNFDPVSPADRAIARATVNPNTELDIANPSSAFGPGSANSVKPDMLEESPTGRSGSGYYP